MEKTRSFRLYLKPLFDLFLIRLSARATAVISKHPMRMGLLTFYDWELERLYWINNNILYKMEWIRTLIASNIINIPNVLYLYFTNEEPYRLNLAAKHISHRILEWQHFSSNFGSRALQISKMDDTLTIMASGYNTGVLSSVTLHLFGNIMTYAISLCTFPNATPLELMSPSVMSANVVFSNYAREYMQRQIFLMERHVEKMLNVTFSTMTPIQILTWKESYQRRTNRKKDNNGNHDVWSGVKIEDSKFTEGGEGLRTLPLYTISTEDNIQRESRSGIPTKAVAGNDFISMDSLKRSTMVKAISDSAIKASERSEFTPVWELEYLTWQHKWFMARYILFIVVSLHYGLLHIFLDIITYCQQSSFLKTSYSLCGEPGIATRNLRVGILGSNLAVNIIVGIFTWKSSLTVQRACFSAVVVWTVLSYAVVCIFMDELEADGSSTIIHCYLAVVIFLSETIIPLKVRHGFWINTVEFSIAVILAVGFRTASMVKVAIVVGECVLIWGNYLVTIDEEKRRLFALEALFTLKEFETPEEDAVDKTLCGDVDVGVNI
ncbi:hypothetical protein HDU76_001529 [Blyttiomyces sp. JEL0837]|nr:hypothetical protein HDU76_001529 [Blyttiomyces sp. JEL0837]